MEINHANQLKEQVSQMNAMQNRLIAMERGQANRSCYPPKLHYGEFPLSRQRLNIIVQNLEVQKFSRSKRPPGYFTFP